MKILVLNCGSSSVKFKLFDMDKKIVLTQGGVEKLGMKDSFLKMTLPNGEKKVFNDFMLDHHVAIALILKILVSKDYGAIKSLDEIDAVGHRVVHGGENFNKSVIITKEVTDGVKACIDMASLHNPANLEGIDTISKYYRKFRKLQFLILLFIKLCLSMHICTVFLTNYIKIQSTQVRISWNQS